MHIWKFGFVWLIIIMCVGCTQKDEPVIRGIVSSCGGFNKSLGKVSMVQGVPDSIVKETLSWKYNDSNQTLVILHTGCFFNCAAELDIQAVKTGDTIYLNEIDHRDDSGRKGKTEAGCSCAFDLLVTIPDMNTKEIYIVFKSVVFKALLQDLSGSFELNSDGTM